LVHPVSQSRWKVERSHGWLDNWRRLVTRYDWYTESYMAFLTVLLQIMGWSGNVRDHLSKQEPGS
jgi:transposase